MDLLTLSSLSLSLSTTFLRELREALPIAIITLFVSAFGPRLSLPGGIDLALILAEISGKSFCQTSIPNLDPTSLLSVTIFGLENVINRQSTRIYVLSGAMAYLTAISLVLLVVMRIAEALKKGWSFL